MRETEEAGKICNAAQSLPTPPSKERETYSHISKQKKLSSQLSLESHHFKAVTPERKANRANGGGTDTELTHSLVTGQW